MAKNSHKPEGIVAKPQPAEIPRAQSKNEISVLQNGNRIQIAADINLEGIDELKNILEHYEGILTQLATRTPLPAGVSLLITHHQKAELRERGYTDDQIHDMTPTEAHRLLGLVD
jgi:hypothetical protein